MTKYLWFSGRPIFWVVQRGGMTMCPDVHVDVVPGHEVLFPESIPYSAAKK